MVVREGIERASNGCWGTAGGTQQWLLGKGRKEGALFTEGMEGGSNGC